MRAIRAAVVAVAMLLPLVATAASVCVWNYDPLDRFYDPVVGDSVDCSYWVAQVLTEQGHAVEVHDQYLPGNIAGYDLVFCLMGWYRC